MKPFLLAFVLILAALGPANAQAGVSDVAGLWVADFFGNKVECHLEQRGQFLYGVAYVTTRAGERNEYHLAGVVEGEHIRALHGSGNYFDGAIQGDDKASGTFFLVKSGQSFAMQAERTKRGQTVPGGLQWPAGYPPAN